MNALAALQDVFSPLLEGSRHLRGSIGPLRRDRVEPLSREQEEQLGAFRQTAANLYEVRYLGRLLGFSVWYVDGFAVRQRLDDDFIGGGNPARYLYVPDGHIWIDMGLDRRDLAPFILHEIVEYFHMMAGLDYDHAHDRANKAEVKLRSKWPVWSNEDPLVVVSQAIHLDEARSPRKGRTIRTAPSPKTRTFKAPTARKIKVSNIKPVKK